MMIEFVSNCFIFYDHVTRYFYYFGDRIDLFDVGFFGCAMKFLDNCDPILFELHPYEINLE